MGNMARQTQALVAFARALTAGPDVSDVLHELTQHIRVALGISGAGVFLRENGNVRFVTAEDERISTLERIQEEHDQGPGVDAIRTGQAVLVTRLADESARWPIYVAKAADLGISAVAAIPMRNSTCIGAVDLYDTCAHDWSPDQLDIAAVFAGIATAHWLFATQLQREHRTVEQLQQALDSRVVIEQAKGILAAERKISIDEAFGQLRRHANDHNARLRVVADAVVRLGLRP